MKMNNSINLKFKLLKEIRIRRIDIIIFNNVTRILFMFGQMKLCTYVLEMIIILQIIILK